MERNRVEKRRAEIRKIKWYGTNSITLPKLSFIHAVDSPQRVMASPHVPYATPASMSLTANSDYEMVGRRGKAQHDKKEGSNTW
jgi:hypothetical protein